MTIDWDELRRDREDMDAVQFVTKYIGAVPEWAHRSIQRAPEFDPKIHCLVYSVEEVELDSVVGTTNQQYAERTWVNVLHMLKRPETIYRALNDQNAFEDYLLHKQKDISFIKISGSYYIAGEGNHRSVVAKFLGVKKIRANVTEYAPRRDAPLEPAPVPVKSGWLDRLKRTFP